MEALGIIITVVAFSISGDYGGGVSAANNNSNPQLLSTRLQKQLSSANDNNKINDNSNPQLLSTQLQKQLYMHYDSNKINDDHTSYYSSNNSNIFTTTITKHRQLEDSSSAASCDSSFLKCILSPTCRECFTTLQENNIDWANVVPDTPCQDVLGFLVAGGHCQGVRNGGTEEQDTFCASFDACVVWDDDNEADMSEGKKGEAGENTTDEMKIDCSALTECSWPGMHEHFLGDGVCHDAMPGCYNSKVCNCKYLLSCFIHSLFVHQDAL